MLMEHLYVWAPGETEARRIIETMADEMLQAMEEAGYDFVMVEPSTTASGGSEDNAYNRADGPVF